MNFIKTSKNWTRVALCTMAISSYAHSTETSISIIKSTGSFVLKVEQVLAQFFNKDNNDISYNDCDILLGKTLTEFINKIEQLIETTDDQLSQKAYEVAQEARKHFNAAYSVIRQYNGKPATEANKFKNDIERVFSPDIAFSAITTKLRALYKDAENINNVELMAVVQQLMLVLEKKKIEWNKKSGPSLLTGLTVRMCKK